MRVYKTKYHFDGVVFSSKTTIDNYIKEKKKNMIEEYGLKFAIAKSNKYWDFLMSIVNSHDYKEEKIGTGIEYFYLQEHPEWKSANNIQLIICRTDNSKISISMIYSKHCGVSTNQYLKNDLQDALRESIAKQIYTYKYSKNYSAKCKLCGNINELEIDHIQPFSLIVKAFLENNTDIPNIFYDDRITGKRNFRKEDYDFQRRWEKFHFEKAQYQTLCGFCNRAKGNKLI